GTLTVTNSIVDARTPADGGTWGGDNQLAVRAQNASGQIVASDSTFTGHSPAGWDGSAVRALSGVLKLTRLDLSGYAHGVDVWGEGSYIRQSYIRTALNGAAHLDGIFISGS